MAPLRQAIAVVTISLALAGAARAAPLARLMLAGSIAIQDDWMGLSPTGPQKAHYTLHRAGDAFKGRAKFNVAQGRAPNERATALIGIPAAASHRFLNSLAACKYVATKYVPLLDHTDDYPSLRIELKVGEESIVFFSRSQGETHALRGVRIAGKVHVVRGDAPSRALKILQPYLQEKLLRNLVERMERPAR